jgi:hypothetical protein
MDGIGSCFIVLNLLGTIRSNITILAEYLSQSLLNFYNNNSSIGQQGSLKNILNFSKIKETAHSIKGKNNSF